METEYAFEEIPVLGKGLLASGTAILESAGADYPGEWFVSAINFDWGLSLRRSVLKMPPCMEAFVFRAVANYIEESPQAHAEWREFEEGFRPPDSLGRSRTRRL